MAAYGIESSGFICWQKARGQRLSPDPFSSPSVKGGAGAGVSKEAAGHLC